MKAAHILLGVQAALCGAKPLASDNIDVGHHVVWSYPGPTIPQELINAVKAGKAGGVIFFGENVKNVPNLPDQIKSLQEAYRQSNAYQGFPLLMMTDQEGGLVNRLPNGPPSAKSIGQSSDPAAAGASAGSTVAKNFESYNINVDLAPVLDVFRDEGDFADSAQRSFGNTPELVAKAAGPWISALQSAGYPATCKHFPGLGSAATEDNTDLKPVTLTLSLHELRKIDMKPYETAIKQGIKMVMASWALYPKVDSKYPAGFSQRFIQKELRSRLGFKGVTITDALEAGSLSSYGATGERAVLASLAGMDILLASARNVTQGQDTYDGIMSALKSGRLDRTRFKQATDRIVSLRRSLKQS